MKRIALSALAIAVLSAGLTPISHAVQILQWERLPLAVPLIVGQERVVFIDRNVRIGLPSAMAERLRVQSAGGAIYLRASAPIESTRLQLQDADTGALILLDISAGSAKDAHGPLEPVRIVDSEMASKRDGSSDTGEPSANLHRAPCPLHAKRPCPSCLHATPRKASMRRCVLWRRCGESQRSACGVTYGSTR